MDKNFRRIIRNWKKEAHIEEPVMWSLREGDFKVYTYHPGPMIGRAGALVAKYRQELIDTSYGRVKTVSFYECGGWA